jgi:hypothetical protein
MWDILKWIPAGIVFLVFGWIHFQLWKGAKESASEWDEEEKRQQRVKDLYPEPPSYEERMGVQYGPEQDE